VFGASSDIDEARGLPELIQPSESWEMLSSRQQKQPLEDTYLVHLSILQAGAWMAILVAAHQYFESIKKFNGM
jgi:hypothetical protein